MAELLAQQIEWIVALQQYRTPGLDAFFKTFTDFGGRHYLWLVPALLWCVDFRTGVRVLPVFAFTLFLNTTLKEWIAQPRPFEFDAWVISDGEEGYGLPSGHAQLVVVFWGAIAEKVAVGWFWELAVAIMVLMGFSRVYLGVHFPTDVLAGWALGALTLWAYVRWRRPLERRLATLSLPAVVGIACGVALLAFDLALVQDEHYIAAGSAGFLAGSGLGTSLASQRLDFRGHGAWWRRVLRYVVGMALTLAVIVPMQRLGVPAGPHGGLFVALDLALLGVWVTFAMPWLFELIHLGDAVATPR